MSIAQKNERGGTLAALFVRRPVLAVVINALIVVAGLAALIGAEVRELPSVEQPVLSISTNFRGAAAETVDREITAVVEGAVARVQGVTSISSSSSNGRSRVTLSFTDGTNLDVATSDVRDALSRVGRQLPDDVEDPTIFKADSDAQPVMQLAMTSDTMPISRHDRAGRRPGLRAPRRRHRRRRGAGLWHPRNRFRDRCRSDQAGQPRPDRRRCPQCARPPLPSTPPPAPSTAPTRIFPCAPSPR